MEKEESCTFSRLKTELQSQEIKAEWMRRGSRWRYTEKYVSHTFAAYSRGILIKKNIFRKNIPEILYAEIRKRLERGRIKVQRIKKLFTDVFFSHVCINFIFKTRDLFYLVSFVIIQHDRNDKTKLLKEYLLLTESHINYILKLLNIYNYGYITI